MKLAILSLIAAGAYGQGLHNQVMTGNVVPPQGAYSSRPSSPATGAWYIVTDDASAGACTGGGSAVSNCRWTGSVWSSIGASGGSYSELHCSKYNNTDSVHANRDARSLGLCRNKHMEESTLNNQYRSGSRNTRSRHCPEQPQRRLHRLLRFQQFAYEDLLGYVRQCVLDGSDLSGRVSKPVVGLCRSRWDSACPSTSCWRYAEPGS